MCKKSEKLLELYFKQKKALGEKGFWHYREEGDMKNKILDDMRKEVIDCRRCRLGSERLNACFGSGNSSSKIMFVGEGPGFNEDHQGKVFVGRAGKLLKKIIKNVFGLQREEVYITNIVKCHPMKDPSDPEKKGNNRPPTPEEVKACIGYLYRQIDIIKPKVLVTLGSPATKTILNEKRGITSLRGSVYKRKFKDTTVSIVPTYHPAYLLRSPSKKKETFKDTKIIKELL